MSDALVHLQLDRNARAAQLGCHCTRAALRAHDLVVHRRGEKGLRRIAIRVVDRLGSRRIVGMKEHRAGRRVGPERQELVGAGQADPTGELGRLVSGSAEPARVEREHRGVVAAGAVPHDEDPARVAAERFGVLQAPGQRCCAVLEEARVAHFGIEPVVGHQDQDAARGQRFADELVVGALPAVPGAAVEEHDHRPARGRRRRGRRVDVELVARQGPVGDVCAQVVGVAAGEGVQSAERRACREREGGSERKGKQAAGAAEGTGGQIHCEGFTR